MTTMAADDFARPQLGRGGGWMHAPGPVAKAAADISGLEAIRAIRDGILPSRRALVIDFPPALAEAGTDRDGT